MTLLEPTSKGMVAVHLVVPAAVPEPPVLVDQVTAATPTLSLAVPLKTMDAAEVEIAVDEGEVMVSAGGVVLLGVAVGGAGGAGFGAGAGAGVGVGDGVGVGAGATGAGVGVTGSGVDGVPVWVA